MQIQRNFAIINLSLCKSLAIAIASIYRDQNRRELKYYGEKIN